MPEIPKDWKLPKDWRDMMKKDWEIVYLRWEEMMKALILGRELRFMKIEERLLKLETWLVDISELISLKEEKRFKK